MPMSKASNSNGPPWIRVRREPFEYGVLPSNTFMNNDSLTSLMNLKSRLMDAASASARAESLNPSSEHENISLSSRITSGVIASCMGLSQDYARLILDALASILPDDCDEIDPLVYADDVDVVGADVDHFIIFLLIQTYKKFSHRVHRDAAVLADVWPSSTTSLDYPPSFSSLLPIKTSSSPRQRSLPAQAEEEGNQLSFVQKHLSSLLSLIAQEEATEEGTIKVISGEKLNRLNLLLRPGVPGKPSESLSQSTPFFANSEPEMPAVPVPLTEVQEWLTSHLSGNTPKENISNTSSNLSGGDVNMTDASTIPSVSSPRSPSSPSIHLNTSPFSSQSNGVSSSSPSSASSPFSPSSSKESMAEGVTLIDGVTKMFAMKNESDVESGSIRISYSNDSVLYVLSPLKYVSIVGCTDSIIVLGAVGKAVKVENCERLQIIVACARMKIANCRECVFYLGINRNPLIFGDNYNLQMAPYNTFYSKLESHLSLAKVDPTVNKWDAPIILGTIDPHDAISRSITNLDMESQNVSILPPEKFNPFVVPVRPLGDLNQQNYTRSNPFLLPKPYIVSLQQKLKSVDALRQTLRTVNLEESKKKELTSVIQAHFKEWLYTSGNVRQVYDISRLDRET